VKERNNEYYISNMSYIWY